MTNIREKVYNFREGNIQIIMRLCHLTLDKHMKEYVLYSGQEGWHFNLNGKSWEGTI